MKNVYTEHIEPKLALWELEIEELEGKSIERRGREEVNAMLEKGWVLLSIYTLRFKDTEDTWFERPMAILGLPKHPVKAKKERKKVDYPKAVVL